ncbi:helix-turn-helix domain-containing protein [Salmonella enterica]|nr:helix-turn-helix domain-containing protein [Salmonella enterica]EAS9473164.1 helix-turn-helix domain-containing protein [Salmonella enterica]EBH4871622.1 helix-turn-helix domain-containing protein [Salmonella enterica]
MNLIQKVGVQVGGGYLLEASAVIEFRKRIKLSQTDFGRLLGVSRLTISRIESGARPVTTIVSLAIRFLMSSPEMGFISPAEIKHSYCVTPPDISPLEHRERNNIVSAPAQKLHDPGKRKKKRRK